MPASDTIEAQGHLIDSGLLSAIFDKIIEHKAAYEILKFDIGRTKDDVSDLEMRITAARQGVLGVLLSGGNCAASRPESRLCAATTAFASRRNSANATVSASPS